MKRGPLTSIRFLLALHLLAFHFADFHKLNPAQPTGDPYHSVSAAIVRFVQHGYCSTGAFFLLSGFVLAAAFLRPNGELSTPRSQFLFARFARIFPLHLAVLLLFGSHFLAIAMSWHDPRFLGLRINSQSFTLISAVTSLSLTQAWFPGYSLLGNPPTWALSVVAFFYISFPFLGPWLAKRTNCQQWLLLLLGPWISIAPSVFYLCATGAEVPYSFWHEFLMRNPLLWTGHFAMGILLYRVCFGKLNPSPANVQHSGRISLGDIAALVLAIAFFLPDTFWQNAFDLGQTSPRLILRHGLLAYLWMVVFVDLAKGRGLLSKMLSGKFWTELGDLSFAVFILQMPMLIVTEKLLRDSHVSMPLRFLNAALLTLIAAKISHRFFDKPLHRWLQNRGFHNRTLQQPVFAAGRVTISTSDNS